MVVKLPEESIDAIVVDPYLKIKTPPDSVMEKLVVTKFAALVAFVALPAEPADVA